MIFRKSWFYLAGIIAGGLGGYLYFRTVGCASGACPITSSPIISSIWGALIGVLLVGAVFSGSKLPKRGVK
ncbi:MAG: hypothetical protein FWF44_00220 [Defluviitaleaceae bacterium]|nr:hypothetical protein [Defluviitaleaceae bacterium]